MKHLISAIALFTLTACGGGGNTSNPFSTVTPEPVVIQQDPVQVQPTPVVEPEPVVFQPTPVVQPEPEPVVVQPVGPVLDISGSWFCASILSDNPFSTDWNNYWQLQFNNDMTVILQDGSNATNTWWNTDTGVAVQWSHTGNTVVYEESRNNLGGIMDDGSHCLRRLPAIDSAPVVLPVVQLDVLEGQFYSCGAQGSAFAQTRSLDGQGNWTGTLFLPSTTPQDNSGTYTIVDNRVWFDNNSVFFTINSDLSLTDPTGTNFCN